MDKNPLDDKLYDTGKKLIEGLDKDGFHYPVVLWMNLPDKEYWTLLFGIPGLNVIGKNDIYGNMKRVIRENELDITIEQISLLDTLSNVCINLKSHFNMGPGITKFNLTPTNINGYQFPESVICRVN